MKLEIVLNKGQGHCEVEGDYGEVMAGLYTLIEEIVNHSGNLTFKDVVEGLMKAKVRMDVEGLKEEATSGVVN